MPIGGSATLLAARALGEKIRTIAAAMLEAHAADIELADGRAIVRGSPERGLSFGDLARAEEAAEGRERMVARLPLPVGPILA